MRVHISYKTNPYFSNMNRINYDLIKTTNIGNIKTLLKDSLNIPIAEQELLIDTGYNNKKNSSELQS